MEYEEIVRIEAVRLRSKTERELLGKLGGEVREVFREQLDTLTELLDLVDAFFHDAEMLREPKTGVALARWLARSERTLKLAEKTRRGVNNYVATLGVNAKPKPNVGENCATRAT